MNFCASVCKLKIMVTHLCALYHKKYNQPLGRSSTSKNLGGISSSSFVEPSSSSLEPIMAAHGVNVDGDNPRHRPGQTAGAEVAYRGLARAPWVCMPVRAMKIRRASGVLLTNQKSLVLLPTCFPNICCCSLGLSRVPLKIGHYEG